jgi:hypothetical protein
MSARKPSSALLIVCVVMVLTGLALWITPQAAMAQCGDPKSSCSTCHAEVQPVAAEGEWHVIHADKDCCRSCHGGNDTTMDKDEAHVGMMSNPLDDIYLSCHQCHPNDYQPRADRFATALGITAKSSGPITVAIQLPSGEPAIPLTATTQPGGVSDATPWLSAMIGVVAVLLAGLALTWRKLSHS